MASSRWSLKLLIHSCLPLPMVTAASVAPLADVAVCRSQAPQSPSSIQTLQANLLLTPTSEVDCVARVHRSARTHRSHSMSHSVELHEPKSSMPQRRSSPERLDVERVQDEGEKASTDRELFFRLNCARQTYEFAVREKHKHAKAHRVRMELWDAFQRLAAIPSYEAGARRPPTHSSEK